jgi:protocatechuate 3,4-dioxygenase beta subunit
MRTRAIASALPALLAAACLEVKSKDPPMCKTTADCDDGEVCDENVCWGNPPAGMFAAVVSAPSERADLVSREVLMLPITSDGWIDDIHLDTAVAFKGRLQPLCSTCDGRTLSATLTVTRPSVFTGGPGFRDVVNVDDGTFELLVPASGDVPYTITVVPADRDLPGTGGSLAQAVPPLQVQRSISMNVTGTVLELGAAGLALPKINGYVVNNAGAGLAGYRVVALGRWAPDQPPTEVSTVDFTGSDGKYALTLSGGLTGMVEIVARPFGTLLRPELHVVNVPVPKATDPVPTKVLTLPSATTGTEIAADLLVDHKDTGGEIAPVGGARVRIAGSYTDLNNGTITRFSAEGTTTDGGVVHLKLLDLPQLPQLAQSYKLSILPPPGSNASALFEKAYTQGLTEQRLGTRIAITGVVLGIDGLPVEDVSVTARPSVRFLWSLEPGPQAFLGEIPTATTVTPNTGEFVLFVDHALANSTGQATTVWGHYDLTFEPTMKARAPSWTRADVELPRDDAQTTVALGGINLPDPAYVRGYVFDDENARVAGAEVKLYQVQTNPTLCQETRFEPLSCPIPPVLLGRAASDKDGVARLTLPR